MRRFRIAAAVAAILAIAGGGYWYFWTCVADGIEAGLAGWAAQQRSIGNRADFDHDPISGFPFAFRTVFSRINLGWHLPDGEASLAAAAIDAEMRPWNLRRIDFASHGTVLGELAKHAGRGPDWVSAAAAAGTVRLFSGGALRHVDVSLSAASLGTMEGETSADRSELSLDLPATPPADYHQPLLGFKAEVHGLKLPPGRRALTTAPIEALAIDASVMGPLPVAETLPAALARWSSAGGTVELRGFSFAQAPLRVEGSGTLALDDGLQPLGALAIRARGLGEAISLLGRDGVLDAGVTRTAQMLAKGMARPDADGVPVVAVSLSLQQGYLWLGPVRLAVLPRLGW